ncbi:hypothetical protein AGOR_G00122520 [Albula goreensis]|uniref:Uncharacterized protein n=1 Tax=Albula goreensis TaxID=1534307 RepID=A0A8T3D998_9TELE|nr:hypothetical protein AGOR_G00122520 [Albula goreensis]
MSSSFQTRIASIMELLAKAALAEMKKVVDLDCVMIGFEISQNENEAEVSKKPQFMTKFSTIMDSLAKEAVNKICKLASEECAVLRLEASQSQSEIGALKRKLELKEQELRTAQGGGAGERPVNTQSVGVQVGCEFAATGSEEAQSHSVSLWGDSGLTDVEEEVSPLQCVVMMVEPEDGLESIVIKEEVLEEDLDDSNVQERIGRDGPVDFGAYSGEKATYRESSTFTENTEGQKAVVTSNSDLPIKDECPTSRKHFKKTKNVKTELALVSLKWNRFCVLS